MAQCLVEVSFTPVTRIWTQDSLELTDLSSISYVKVDANIACQNTRFDWPSTLFAMNM